MDKKIGIVTTIRPDSQNGGGRPSGLIYTCIQSLKEAGFSVDLIIVSEDKNPWRKRLGQYGFFCKKVNGLEKYTALFVYPDNALLNVPSAIRPRCIVLGPDSPSFRDARLLRASQGLFKLYRLAMYALSLYHESRVVHESHAMLVVGRTDELWMKLYHSKIYHSFSLRQRVQYLPHPNLSSALRKNLHLDYETLKEEKRFVFSGFINERYERSFIHQVLHHLSLRQRRVHFVVLGKRNFWIADMIRTITDCNVERIDWIDDYLKICRIGRDVHCLPITVGAGTKNRCLTALSNGLEVISTPMGVENTPFHEVSGLYITSSPESFAEAIISCSNRKNTDEMAALIASRIRFRREVEKRYLQVMKSIIQMIREM